MYHSTLGMRVIKKKIREVHRYTESMLDTRALIEVEVHRATIGPYLLRLKVDVNRRRV